jgi:hypothetical protein
MAEGDVEAVVVLDGAWADPPLPEDPRVVTIFRGQPLGLREAARAGAAAASGDCLVMYGRPVMQGWDRALRGDIVDRATLLKEADMAKIAIVRATYGIGEKDGEFVDVTKAVSKLVGRERSASFKVTNEALKQTAPPPFAGKRKRLTVAYTLDGTQGTANALERKTIAIPAKG